MKEEQAAIIEDRFSRYFAHWSLHLPPGGTTHEEPGTIADHGWVIRYVFGSEGEPYLEFYATHRMTDDHRVRIYGTGEMKALATLRTMYAYTPEVPGHRERAARENRERNVLIASELEALGLYPVDNVTSISNGSPLFLRVFSSAYTSMRSLEVALTRSG